MPPEPTDENVPESTTSSSLLQRLRANNQEAWQRIVALYTPLVHFWCGRWGIARQDADDLVQEVFQAAASSLDRFRRDRPGDSFRSWLRGIAHHRAMTYLRQRLQQPQAAGGSEALHQMQAIADSDPSSPLDDDPPSERRALFLRAAEMVRAEFEERTWRFFWQTAVEGRSPVDVAQDHNATPAAVRKAKSRVLHRLKEEIGELLP
jgi:RNA polymerase sigma-70 factor (ECF subfamily)